MSVQLTAAELKLNDFKDTTVSISTAPQNRRESPPPNVTTGLRPICSRGLDLLHRLSLQQYATQPRAQQDFPQCVTARFRTFETFETFHITTDHLGSLILQVTDVTQHVLMSITNCCICAILDKLLKKF